MRSINNLYNCYAVWHSASLRTKWNMECADATASSLDCYWAHEEKSTNSIEYEYREHALHWRSCSLLQSSLCVRSNWKTGILLLLLQPFCVIWPLDGTHGSLVELKFDILQLQYSAAPPVPVTPALPVGDWCAVATYVFLQKIVAACTTDVKATQERCRCEQSCACRAGQCHSVSCGEDEKCQLIFHPKLEEAHCSLDETLYTTFEVWILYITLYLWGQTTLSASPSDGFENVSGFSWKNSGKLCNTFCNMASHMYVKAFKWPVQAVLCLTVTHSTQVNSVYESRPRTSAHIRKWMENSNLKIGSV